ncbi:cell wall-active antibiotics response protein LiaF [Bacillus swezeyi]|uniref:Uncharacterized protein n=1 Tax=Bacillus swezeyi TaxID=1925020 RepID=A0A1R1S001_9BACI|nr:cell wall-active antibiotics response protein LiaF [Bacillus swezeyi]MEC1259662.1 cell wall-active antibiotics response protein LiaF [Bacillus swezeyi]MED2927375.1 cell wall-active antibiotics response protein LiaF [Bacillus swezeyi]MED2941627.1 cell wall-active antibiotics response protein LiaF [Bacillus swezeyi]MED2962573.1 cell wall-active antibiotics response protein LiaF [Bacillus swezeyi]MED2977175.1 cell wall-active antibiotics response protein LiaF [Bacillus swezeyi]
MRLTKNQLIGLVIVLFGISIFFQNSGLGDVLFWPLAFLFAGYLLHKYSRRWLGSVMFIFAGFLVLKDIFSITFSLFGFFFAAFLIYAGYRLVTNQPVFDRSKPKERGKDMAGSEPFQKKTSAGQHSFFFGDVKLMKKPFDLNDLNISGFIGDVKIDLSKAIISDEENTIVITGLIGDVDIYIPSDLDVSISSSAFIGDIDIIGDRKSGIGNQIYTESENYEQSARRVKISISLFIGDVDVRFI